MSATAVLSWCLLLISCALFGTGQAVKTEDGREILNLGFLYAGSGGFISSGALEVRLCEECMRVCLAQSLLQRLFRAASSCLYSGRHGNCITRERSAMSALAARFVYNQYVLIPFGLVPVHEASLH